MTDELQGFSVPEEERPALLAAIAGMRALADFLHAVPQARYETPVITGRLDD